MTVEEALEAAVVLSPAELPCVWSQPFLQPCKNIGIYTEGSFFAPFGGALCAEHYKWYFQNLYDSWWNTSLR